MSVTISIPESMTAATLKKDATTLVFKASSELGTQDIKRIERLRCTEQHPTNSNFLQQLLKGKRFTTVAMLYHKGQLAATLGLRLDTLHTPFSRRKLPVFYAGLAFHAADASLLPVPDPFEWMSVRFMRNQLGPAWRLKNTVHMAMTMNPRRIEKYHRRTNATFPLIHELAQPAISTFVQNYVWEVLEIDHPFVDDFLINIESEKTDITAAWHKAIRSPKDKFNEYCFENGILKQENDSIFLTSRRAILCAHHTPSTQIKAIFNRY